MISSEYPKHLYEISRPSCIFINHSIHLLRCREIDWLIDWLIDILLIRIEIISQNSKGSKIKYINVEIPKQDEDIFVGFSRPLYKIRRFRGNLRSI
jgi:hypothetical protein